MSMGRIPTLYEYRGQKYSMRELAEKLGLKYVTLYQRVHYGWPEEHWADTPIRGGDRRSKEYVRLGVRPEEGAYV